MVHIHRLLRVRQQDLQRRVSQSMHDSGYATAKCRKLQRKLAQLKQIKRALRTL